MAVLSVTELAPIRRHCERSVVTVGYTKAQINAALQAIEDAMTTRLVVAGYVGRTWPQVLSGIIDTATGPFVFTATQKRILLARWSELKFDRDK